MVDLETAWLGRAGETVADYDDLCQDLAEEVSSWLARIGRKHRILNIESSLALPITAFYHGGERLWSYHAVILADGRIHDAWLGASAKPKEYFSTVFGGQRLDVEHRNRKGNLVLVEEWRSGRLVRSRRE
jgi:hypothetical protein